MSTGKLIPETTIAVIKDRTNLASLIQEYTALRSIGGGKYKGLCPFHDERTPSFHVNNDAKFWHCFGCGDGGDAIEFLKQIDNITFVEAIHELSNKAGVSIDTMDEEAEKAIRLRANILKANTEAANFFVNTFTALPRDHAAYTFLQGQKQLPDHVITEAQVGYSGDGTEFVNHMTSLFDTETLTTANLVYVNKQGGVVARFQDRIMFPIKDPRGKVIGFGGRGRAGQSAKYLNTASTPVYNKSKVLYGFDIAKKVKNTSDIIIVEGYTDVLALRAAGIMNAVAACGTAFGEQHARIIRNTLSDNDEYLGRMLFMFDGDEAGQNASIKVFDMSANYHHQTYAIPLPPGQDPGDIWIQQGVEGIQKTIESAIPIVQYRLRLLATHCDDSTPESRVQSFNTLLPALRAITNKTIQDAYTEQSAKWLQIPTDQAHRLVRREVKTTLPTTPKVPTTDFLPNKVEREAFGYIIKYPEVAPIIRRGLDGNMFTHETTQKVATQALQYQTNVADNILNSYKGDETELSDVQKIISSVLFESETEPTPSELENYVRVSYFKLMYQFEKENETRIKAQLETVTVGTPEYDDLMNKLEESIEFKKEIQNQRKSI